MTVAEQTAQLVAGLPPDKVEEVLDFARFLAEQVAEQQWQKTLDNAHKLPKFRKFVQQAEKDIREGKGIPLDPSKL